MAQSLKARSARLEAPHANVHSMPVSNYRFRKACYEVLSRLDGASIPDDQELWAMAEADARSGRPPDYVAVLQAVWEEHHDP